MAREKKNPQLSSYFVFCYFSQQAITKEMFDDALRDLQDDMFLVVAGRTVRVNQGINSFD
jgi:hypothetical protein